MPGTLSPLPNVRTARSMRRDSTRRVRRHPRPVARISFDSVAWLSASRRLGCQPGCGADSARQCWLGLVPAANNESTGQLSGAVSSSIFDL
jgi:hypothetical protein